MPANSHAEDFDRFHIDQELLRQRAFNLRWATVDDDVIPLTAAPGSNPPHPDRIGTDSRERLDSTLSAGNGLFLFV